MFRLDYSHYPAVLDAFASFHALFDSSEGFRNCIAVIIGSLLSDQGGVAAYRVAVAFPPVIEALAAVINTADGINNQYFWRAKIDALQNRYPAELDYELIFGLMKRMRNDAAHELLHGFSGAELILAFKGLCQVVSQLIYLAIHKPQDYPAHIDISERTALLAVCPP